MEDTDLSQLDQMITDYVGPYSTRRMSEVFHNTPPNEVTARLTQLMAKATNSFFHEVTQFQPETSITLNLEALTLYYSTLLAAIPETSPEYPQMALQEYFTVNRKRNKEGSIESTTYDPDRIIADIRSRYDENSLPYLLLDIMELYRHEFDISAQEAAIFLMEGLQYKFDEILSLANAIALRDNIDTTEALVLALLQYKLFIEKGLVSQVIQTKKSHISYLTGNTIADPSEGDTNKKHEAISISLSDADGVIEVGHLQDKPYTKEEMDLAQWILMNNVNIIPSLLAFHLLFIDYSYDYLRRHPEYLAHSFEPFNTLFAFDMREESFSIYPNPKFLAIMSSNWMPSIIREALKEYSLEDLYHNPNLLRLSHIRDGIFNGKELSIFNSLIFGFNQAEGDSHVTWTSILHRVCPAKGMITQAGMHWLPQIYQMIATQHQ